MLTPTELRKYVPEASEEDVKEFLSKARVLGRLTRQKYGSKIESILKFCLEDCLDSTNGTTRITGGLFAKHPVSMAIKSYEYPVSWMLRAQIICHDNIEEKVDKTMAENYPDLPREERNTVRTQLRREYLEDFGKRLTDFVIGNEMGKYTRNVAQIVSGLDMVSRFRTENQTYYGYTESIFSERLSTRGRRSDKKDREGAIIVKLFDMPDNTESLFEEGRMPNLERLERTFARLVRNYREGDVKRVRGSTKEPNLGKSIDREGRLRRVYKNIYFFHNTREYLRTAVDSSEIRIIRPLLAEATNVTLQQARLDREMLRVYSELGPEEISIWDKELDYYDITKNGFSSVTERGEEPISELDRYRRLDGIINEHTERIEQQGRRRELTSTRTEEEFYINFIAFTRVLEKMSDDDDYRIGGLERRVN